MYTPTFILSLPIHWIRLVQESSLQLSASINCTLSPLPLHLVSPRSCGCCRRRRHWRAIGKLTTRVITFTVTLVTRFPPIYNRFRLVLRYHNRHRVHSHLPRLRRRPVHVLQARELLVLVLGRTAGCASAAAPRPVHLGRRRGGRGAVRARLVVMVIVVVVAAAAVADRRRGRWADPVGRCSGGGGGGSCWASRGGGGWGCLLRCQRGVQTRFTRRSSWGGE